MEMKSKEQFLEISALSIPGRGRCAPFSEIIKGSRKPTSAPIQDTILLVMAAAEMKMDTTGSPEGLMMS